MQIKRELVFHNFALYFHVFVRYYRKIIHLNKGKIHMKHSLHKENRNLGLLQLYINGKGKCHSVDAPIT